MITKECFGSEIVTSHEHLHDCAPGNPETHMVGSERFVCVLCKHVTFAGSDGASRFPFTLWRRDDEPLESQARCPREATPDEASDKANMAFSIALQILRVTTSLSPLTMLMPTPCSFCR
jgi:hypothetical protein